VILVDTSVWIDHLHRSIPRLVELLESEDVLIHPIVIGELACGQLAKRDAVLRLLRALPSAVVASDAEALNLIDRHLLMGKGIGYFDVHLLASVMLTSDAQLWTRDKHLAEAAVRLDVAFAER
jgi:predicted nucleic acid-binding protein